MISNKHFLSKTLVITAFVIIGCAISACSEDEAGTSGESSTFISKLKSKKWVYNGYDVDLLEKQVILKSATIIQYTIKGRFMSR